MSPQVRILIPVFNALRLTRRCLLSVKAQCPPNAAIEVVDDASDSYVSEQLSQWCQDWAIEYSRNEQNLGFIKTCNHFIERRSEALLLILNSDTFVTENWLAPLLALMDSKPKAALLCPMSNEASLHSLPMPAGWTAPDFAKSLSEQPEPAFDLVTASGFAMLLRRQALLEVGAFDPAFGRGYGEESDLSMRLRQAGWQVLGVPQSFVQHTGQASFGDTKDEFMGHPNYRLFMQRWRDDYHRGLSAARQRGALARLRAQYPSRGPKTGLAGAWQLFWRMQQQRGWSYTLEQGLRRGPKKLWQSLRSRGLRWTLSEGLVQVQGGLRAAPKPERSIEGPRFSGHSRVLVLFEELNSAGGVKVLLSLINGLIERGFGAMAAVPASSPVDRRWLSEALFEPWFYESEAELLSVPKVDVVLSSLWSTAQLAVKLRDAGRAGEAWSYIQDDEARFYSQPSLREAVQQSYHGPDKLLVTSQWLKQRLKDLGHESELLPPGIEWHDFYPDGTLTERTGQPLRVLAMARPQARRGRPRLESVFGALATNREFELATFGPTALPLPSSIKQHGFVQGRALRALFQWADVYFDCSEFQAFGLPSLEAMACECVVLGPREGGWRDFLEEGENGLIADSAEQAVEQLRGLRRKNASERLIRMGRAARLRAAQYRMSGMIGAFIERLSQCAQ